VSRPFDTVAIIGVGLIGGSLGAALRALEEPPRVVGVMRSAEGRAWALENGVLDDALAPEDALAGDLLCAGGADLVVVATPVEAAMGWLEALGETGYDGLVTDVASTKAGVQAAADRHLGPNAVFIGGHPMAGSERTGVQASNPELFRDAYYVLTPSADTPAEDYRRLHSLVSALGARVIAVDPDEHDEAVAAISHVPHVAASALTNLAAERAGAGHDVLRLAAGGFKDMTRIAAGSPELWTGICLDNREAVVRGLEQYTAQIVEFSSMLREGDAERMRAWLERAAEVRGALPARWVPASAKLSVLSVPVSDRPGAVSTVAQAAARAGCNIEDIEIDHTSEDTAILRLVLTDEGDFDALMSELTAEGLAPDLRPLAEEA
jgi:prephenate dehydrogenase